MSFLRTNKIIRRKGDFLTRLQKEKDFTEYVYVFADGTKATISRSELIPEVDKELYKSLKEEVNNNEVQMEKHGAYGKDQEGQDFILNMQTSQSLEEEVLKNIELKTLRAAIKSLPPLLRNTLIKKYFMSMTNTAIAKAEKVGEAAVRDRLRRAYEQLKKSLSERV